MNNLRLCYELDGQRFTVSSSDGVVTLEESTVGSRYRVKVKAGRTVKLLWAAMEFPADYDRDDKIFVNGYQSWTDSREYLPGENLPDIYKKPSFIVQKFTLDGSGDARFKKYEKGVLHGFDISYVKGKNSFAVVSHNTENAFLIVNHRVQDNRLVLESDVAGLELSGEFPLFDFLLEQGEAEAILDRELGETRPVRKLFGYTSWYNHYQDISEKKIRLALEQMDSRFDLFQIDDGFEPFVGDWLCADETKFPHGLSGIVETIHQKGMMAGIWLAPFVAEEKSGLYQSHPDWFLRTPDGTPVKCGSNWSGYYALDFYNPEARDYMEQVLRHYAAMGFDFFKLDFLFAACAATPGDKTRAQVSREAYRFLRQALGDRLILGCGAVVSSSFGLFDYMRIGPDMSLRFDDVWYMRHMHRERVSTKLTLQNTIYRSFLNGKVFGNDPDVFLLRDDNIKLTAEQKKSTVLLNALFGSLMMTSDDIGTYDGQKTALLNQALVLFEKGRVLGYRRKGRLIEIEAQAGEEQLLLTYNTQKGTLMRNG